MSCNVLQYEFFHVGGRGKSLEDVMVECAERTEESLTMALVGDDTGPGIKTVVRMYDRDDHVSDLVRELEHVKQKLDERLECRRSGLFVNLPRLVRL